MSCTISISNALEDIWMIRNAIFRWLSSILYEEYPNDSELTDCLQYAEATGGLSLERLKEENPILANRVAVVLMNISRKISEGEFILHDDIGKKWSEMQQPCENSFKALYGILERWKPATIKDWDEYAKANCDDPKLTCIWALWLKLSAARYAAEEGESLMGRLAFKPWESDDPLISEAWENLTAPENLEDLEYWNNRGEMNPCAREATDKAIEDCRKRKLTG